jgi:hypothetical protein
MPPLLRDSTVEDKEESTPFNRALCWIDDDKSHMSFSIMIKDVTVWTEGWVDSTVSYITNWTAGTCQHPSQGLLEQGPDSTVLDGLLVDSISSSVGLGIWDSHARPFGAWKGSCKFCVSPESRPVPVEWCPPVLVLGYWILLKRDTGAAAALNVALQYSLICV